MIFCLNRVTGLQVRRTGCCTDIIRPFVIYSGGVEFRDFSELLVATKELLHPRRRRKVADGEKLLREFSLSHRNRVANQDFSTAVDLGTEIDKFLHKKSEKRRKERDDMLLAASVPVSPNFSYLLYPMSTEVLQMEICHISNSTRFPALHVCLRDSLYLFPACLELFMNCVGFCIRWI